MVRLGALAVAVAAVAGGLVFSRAKLGSPDADTLWAQAEVALRAGRLEAAAAALETLKTIRKPTPLDWLLRAQVSTGLGHDAEALSALRNVDPQHPLAAQASLLAGRIARNMHRLRDAEASLKQALERDPNLVEAHKELVYIYGVQLRKPEIDAEFKALSHLSQLTHHDLFTWGLTHFTDWDPGIAKDLQAALEADPSDRYSRLAVARLLFDQPAMEATVTKILESLPQDDPDAAALRVELHLAHGRVEEASALLKRTPCGNVRLSCLRGREALLRKDFSAAVQHFRDALSYDSANRNAIAELGRALLLSGDRAGAHAYLERSGQLDRVYKLINRVSRPDRERDRADLTQLGRACEDAGFLEEAKGWYTLAIMREPLDADAQQGLRRLAQSDSDSTHSRGV